MFKQLLQTGILRNKQRPVERIDMLMLGLKKFIDLFSPGITFMDNADITTIGEAASTLFISWIHMGGNNNSSSFLSIIGLPA